MCHDGHAVTSCRAVFVMPSTSVEEREQYFAAARQAWLSAHSAIDAMAGTATGEVTWQEYLAWMTSLQAKWLGRQVPGKTVMDVAASKAGALYAAAVVAQRTTEAKHVASVAAGFGEPRWRRLLTVLSTGERVSRDRTST